MLKSSLLPAAFNTAKCEKLQKEKEALERRFEEELRRLGWQQQAEVQELRERLQQQFQAESARLRAEHQDQLLRMRCQHQEQVSGLGCSAPVTGGEDPEALEKMGQVYSLASFWLSLHPVPRMLSPQAPWHPLLLRGLKLVLCENLPEIAVLHVTLTGHLFFAYSQ